MASDTGDDRVLRAWHRGLSPEGDHPDEDTWVRFSTGALEDEARERLADHVVSCQSCSATYRALGVLRAQAPGGAVGTASTIPPKAWWSGSTTWLAAAATIALAVTAAVVQVRAPTSSTSAPASAIDTPAPAPASPPATPAPPPVRAWARDVNAPEVELPARYALVVRGPRSMGAFMTAFGAAIVPYREGRYAEAATALDQVARDFPDAPEAAFYLGVARLLSGDPAGAKDALALAESAETLGDAARWFGAVAAEQAGQSGAADALLDDLCGRPGNYRSRACAAAGVAR